MSPDLTELLSATADLLDDAGPLEPVRLALAGRDVQLTFAEFTTMADQRASVDRLAAATGTDPVLSELGADAYTYTLTTDLPGGMVLVAARIPPWGGTSRRGPRRRRPPRRSCAPCGPGRRPWPPCRSTSPGWRSPTTPGG
ncbi:hypothetical protein ACFVUW_28650 [Streptomyces xiamenensis]|uniref:hypothetical protein n=1 Tax=Streptomyces xiamenensis TaxID=408015 RepID=UPI0036F0C8D1